MGNYSRFVRPGAVRQTVRAYDAAGRFITEGETDPDGLMCTAYRNADGTWAIVMLNYGVTEREITLNVKDKKVKKWQPYLTGEGEEQNLLPVQTVTNGERTMIPARSAVTFVSLPGN